MIDKFLVCQLPVSDPRMSVINMLTFMGTSWLFSQFITGISDCKRVLSDFTCVCNQLCLLGKIHCARPGGLSKTNWRYLGEEMWRCKDCNVSLSSRLELLKHIRLQHRHRQRYPCPHTTCPCTFKTWNAVHIHLSRVHPQQKSQELLELSTFSCHLCTCNDLPTEKDYFVHIGTHLRSNETVACMFEG